MILLYRKIQFYLNIKEIGFLSDNLLFNQNQNLFIQNQIISCNIYLDFIISNL